MAEKKCLKKKREKYRRLKIFNFYDILWFPEYSKVKYLAFNKKDK